MDHIFLGFSVFLACIVEMVEALTIVLAIGVTRGWRSTLLAAGAAAAVLGGVVGLSWRALEHVSTSSIVVLHWIWLVVGALLLVFGLQWLRKAVLRYVGVMPLHDEEEKYKQVRAQSKKAGKDVQNGIDWYAFVVVFKGVLLEGLEVVFIVLTFGFAQANMGLGALAALAAFVLVALLGAVLHRPLARLPENAMKFAVGVILTTFGTYFGAEGVGVMWPHGQVAILFILAFYLSACGGLAILFLARPVTRGARRAVR
jgi:uncharacterized membrane protein